MKMTRTTTNLKTKAGSLIPAFDEKKYKKLLRRTMPVVIQPEAEYERSIEEINRLMSKGISSGLEPEEDRFLMLLVKLVKDYEKEKHPIPSLPPHEVLQYLMEEEGIKQKDLLHIFKSNGITSEVVNGKRSISKAQAKSLAEYFNVSVELFL
jgi:HTH-type transcriptional regulator/antitoxin HigA